MPTVRGMQSFGPMVYALLDNGNTLTLERAFLRRHFFSPLHQGKYSNCNAQGTGNGWWESVRLSVVPLEQGLLGLRRQNQTQKQDCKEKLRTLDFTPQVALVSSSCTTCSSPAKLVPSTLRGFSGDVCI